MNQQLNSRADYYGSPLPRVAIAPSHTAPSQWRSSFLVDCTVEICLLLPIFAHLILNDPLRNARGNRGNRHFLTRPAREFLYHESPSITVNQQILLLGTFSTSPNANTIIFTKATFLTNSHWFRIWCWLIHNYPKLLRYLHKCRILWFFQWVPPLHICWNTDGRLIESSVLFYTILPYFTM